VVTLMVENKLVFLHVPRTGGTAITNALEKNYHGRPRREFNVRHYYEGTMQVKHPGLEQIRKWTDLPVVAFTRHPFDILVSWWGLKRQHPDKLTRGRDAAGPKLLQSLWMLWRKSLRQFLELYLEHTPGYVSQSLDIRLASSRGGPEHMGRTETLERDMNQFLGMYGIQPIHPVRGTHSGRVREAEKPLDLQPAIESVEWYR
jgi:hypothetical protein